MRKVVTFFCNRLAIFSTESAHMCKKVLLNVQDWYREVPVGGEPCVPD